MKENMNTMIQSFLWQLKQINGEHTLQAKNLESCRDPLNI
jgi:hypothetical protein